MTIQALRSKNNYRRLSLSDETKGKKTNVFDDDDKKMHAENNKSESYLRTRLRPFSRPFWPRRRRHGGPERMSCVNKEIYERDKKNQGKENGGFFLLGLEFVRQRTSKSKSDVNHCFFSLIIFERSLPLCVSRRVSSKRDQWSASVSKLPLLLLQQLLQA